MGGLRGWDRDQKTAFSEYGHFAYQIKGNDTYSNMLVNILPVDPHDPRGGGGGGGVVKRSNFNFFRTWSCCISN